MKYRSKVVWCLCLFLAGLGIVAVVPRVAHAATICSACKGTGKDICQFCGGKGCAQCNWKGGEYFCLAGICAYGDCKYCGGTGKIYTAAEKAAMKKAADAEKAKQAAATASDKVLTDRATALVKGLRDGNSWNATIADLKKDFPDLKELEPFKIEGSEIQTQEFGALYNLDAEVLKKDFQGLTCTNYPKMRFSFYQNKLYRVEISSGVMRGSSQYAAYRIANSFFSEAEIDSIGDVRKKNMVPLTFWYGNIRYDIDNFGNTNNEKLKCGGRDLGSYLYRYIYTNTDIESQ